MGSSYEDVKKSFLEDWDSTQGATPDTTRAKHPTASAKTRTGAEMIAHHRFRLGTDNNTAEIDSSGLAEEIDNALAARSALAPLGEE